MIKTLLFLVIFFLLPQYTYSDFSESLFQNKCRVLFKGKKGCMLALNPENGKILAVVNPQCVYGDAYPPGSLFKLVTAGAVLSSNAVDESHTEICRGKEKINGKTFQCWLKKGHGKLALKEALTQSCNLYFYKLGAKLRISHIVDFASAFGFGKTAKSGMADEDSGELPRAFNGQNKISFAAGEHPVLSVTPAQVAVFVSAIANGGFLVKPSFHGFNPERIENVPRMEYALSFLSSAMRESVRYGTCKELSSLKKDIAGKTGTARHRHGFRTHAWFAGFYPSQGAELVLVLFLEKGEGRKDAVPLAREVFKAYFESVSEK